MKVLPYEKENLEGVYSTVNFVLYDNDKEYDLRVEYEEGEKNESS